MDAAGDDDRPAARGDPQLGRRQRLHRPAGFQDTHATAEAVAAALSDWGTETGAIEVAVCSTGLIGDRLPMDKVLAGVKEVVHEMAGGLTGGEEAARAIMTTDTVPKQVALHHSTGTTGPWAGWPRARGCWRRRWPRCCA